MSTERPKAAGYLYLAITLVLLVLVGALALTARQPPPPSIAEFAPQAVENITDSPSDQSFAGRGAGGSVPTPTPEPEAAANAPIDVPRVRRCVGDPPRQIEDPQSPPCVPYWVGDNGGATTKGVNKDTITVVVTDTDALPDGATENLEAFFNRRFEFYGRRLEVQVFEAGDGTPTGQNADAINVDESYHAFAALDYGGKAFGGQYVYYDELANRGIISIHWNPNYSEEGHTKAMAPYQWEHNPEFIEELRHFGAYVCRGLKGRPAAYAGPAVVGKPRVFGIMEEASSHGSQVTGNVDVLEQALKACGAPVPVRVGVNDFDSFESKNALTQMQANDVTTVLCVCNGGNIGTIHMQNANSQGYYPEWTFNDFLQMNDDFLAQSLWPSSQSVHAFGITFANKLDDREKMPWFWAMREVDPGYSGAYDWSHRYYVMFLQLASGIQMAGPRLTPETFRAAMIRTKFPNPAAGRPPLYQASITYADGEPYMQRDGTVIWFNPTMMSPITGNPGTFCYASLGARYTLDTWPTDDTAPFKAPCR